MATRNGPMKKPAAQRSRVSIVFEDRPDGGLRAYSPDVPMFALSHSDPKYVRSAALPILQEMIARNRGVTDVR